MEENRRSHNMAAATWNSRKPTSNSQIPASSSLPLELNDPAQACRSQNIKGSGDEKGLVASEDGYHNEKLAAKVEVEAAQAQAQAVGDEVAGREKLKRHREEVVGKVHIPENWGQEELLKDWIDYATFDALLAPHRMIVTARDALIAEGRKAAARSQRLRIHTGC